MTIGRNPSRRAVFTLVLVLGVCAALVPISSTAAVPHQSTITQAAANPATDYSSAVQSDSPISFWQLNDAAGSSAAADSEGLNPGAIIGGVTTGQPGPMAGSGSMLFDGVSGYVDLSGDTTLQPPDTLTVEAWVMTTSAPSTAFVFRSRYYGYGMSVDNGLPSMYVAVSGGATGSQPVNDGTWHYLVATKDAATISLYVDGVLSTSSPDGQAMYYGGQQIAIGQDARCTCSFFSGSIADVAVYDHALTADRVLAHYAAAGRLGACPSANLGNVIGDPGFEAGLPAGSTLPAPQSVGAWTTTLGFSSTEVTAGNPVHSGSSSASVVSPGGTNSQGYWWQDLAPVCSNGYVLDFWVYPLVGDQQVELATGWDRGTAGAVGGGLSITFTHSATVVSNEAGAAGSAPPLRYATWSHISLAVDNLAHVSYSVNGRAIAIHLAGRTGALHPTLDPAKAVALIFGQLMPARPSAFNWDDFSITRTAPPSLAPFDVGFGDSVAAGYGLGPSGGAAGGSSNDNLLAYPAVLAGKLGISAENFAFEGANAANVATQICQSVGSASVAPVGCAGISAPALRQPRLVTITVGGNDIHFDTCIIDAFQQGFFEGQVLPTNPCAATSLQANLLTLQSHLTADLDLLAQYYPNVPVVLTGYYNPLGAYRLLPRNCLLVKAAVAGPLVTAQDWVALAAYLTGAPKARQLEHDTNLALTSLANRVVASLNSALASAVAGRQAVAFSPVSFASRGLCDPSPLVFGPQVDASFTVSSLFGGTTSVTIAVGLQSTCVGPKDPSEVTQGPGSGTVSLLGLITLDYSYYFSSNCVPHPTAEGQRSLAGQIFNQLP